ncbi:hypothetical protein EDC01DRAFT_635845 [Geopyxis carbonaria]|nr:hypothetical protein EDC01DRAFT_635845 [Geopyxis carbonaria]
MTISCAQATLLPSAVAGSSPKYHPLRGAYNSNVQSHRTANLLKKQSVQLIGGPDTTFNYTLPEQRPDRKPQDASEQAIFWFLTYPSFVMFSTTFASFFHHDTQHIQAVFSIRGSGKFQENVWYYVGMVGPHTMFSLGMIVLNASSAMIEQYARKLLEQSMYVDTEVPELRVVLQRTELRFLKHHPQFFKGDRQFRAGPYKALTDKYNNLPEHEYNFDETGFRVGIGKDHCVITVDPKRPVYLPSSTNRDFVSVMETVSGDGFVLTPVITMPGGMHQE